MFTWEDVAFKPCLEKHNEEIDKEKPIKKKPKTCSNTSGRQLPQKNPME